MTRESGSTRAPVITGLTAGVGLIIVFGILQSYNEQILPPSSLSSTYSTNQKAAIRIALANDTVQELFHDKVMEIGVARATGGPDSVWLIIIQEKEDSEKHVLVRIDQSSGRVTSITPSIGWLSAYPDSLLLAPDRAYEAEILFGEPLNKTKFNSITSSHNGIRLEYYEYLATNNITGGVSTELFPDITDLENDLKTRHNADLIGVSKIMVRANSDDLRVFSETNRDNISEMKFIAVLGRLP